MPAACTVCSTLEKDKTRPRAKYAWLDAVWEHVKGTDQHVAFAITRMFRGNGTGYSTDPEAAENAGRAVSTVAESRQRLDVVT